MKTRLITVITAALIMCAYVSAQPDNCCGIDRQCTTDKEWSDGFWANQNNECAAPAQSQSPAQSPAPTTTTATSNIDNCCFIDRQCNTNQEWDAGYWAFQNNQCVAPAQSPAQPQSPAQSPAPTTNTTTSNIDNCCFVDRQCTTEAEWSNGYLAFQNNQCKAPAGSSGTVTPSESVAGVVQSFHEILGAETLTTHPVTLAQGIWNATFITAANAIVRVNSDSGDRCISPGYTTRRIATKIHNIFGGGNEANGQFNLLRDCRVSFHVWAPRHSWSLKLNKS